MMLADGTLRILTLHTIQSANPGSMPIYILAPKSDMFKEDIYYADRVVGYNRQYAAMGADQYISKLVRIFEMPGMPVEMGDYALIGNDQYRVDVVQFLRDEDGLKVRDLTLSKLEERYDCITD